MRIILLIGGAVVLIVLIYTFSPSNSTNSDLPAEDTLSYMESIRQHRLDIDEFMKDDPASPFRQDKELSYPGLSYYEIDPSYRIEAEITRTPEPRRLSLRMSNGKQEEYITYAEARFRLQDVDQKVILLKSEAYWDEPWVFLPFYDETSALETYGGGRYLEIDYSGGDQLVIDFNLAYNPYCAYTPDYACPLPPRANQITVPVRAGEKNFEHFE